MPKQTLVLAADYSARLRTLDATRTKVEALFIRKELSQDDIEQFYSGLFISIFSEFESLIEMLFLGLLEGTHTSAKPSTTRRVEIVPAILTREILFEGRKFLDWVPLDKHTRKRSERYLNRGEPFSLLERKDEKLIESCNSIRNAVAHRSDAARASFAITIAALPLLPEEKTPTGYLRSRPYGPSGPTQFEIACGELERIATKLCE